MSHFFIVATPRGWCIRGRKFNLGTHPSLDAALQHKASLEKYWAACFAPNQWTKR